MQIYAQPLLHEKHTIHSQHNRSLQDSLTSRESHTSFRDNIARIFQSLEHAIKHACSIYSYHVLHSTPPPDIDDILDDMRITSEGIPTYAPGEGALAWVYFIAAAESTVPSKRTFFSKRLMGIFERGTFNNSTMVFVMLHSIWNCQETGSDWTETLRRTPSVLVLQ